MSTEPTVIAALNTVLAETYALAVATHGAHWNVTGQGFFQLHDAFSSQYEALFEAADDIAERLRAVGGRAPGGIRALAAASTIADTAVGDGLALAGVLRDGHRRVAAAAAAGVKAAQAAGDEATADLLIGRIEAHDKTAWMLGAFVA